MSNETVTISVELFNKLMKNGGVKVEESGEKRGRGRPAGAKDKEPRKKRVISDEKKAEQRDKSKARTERMITESGKDAAEIKFASQIAQRFANADAAANGNPPLFKIRKDSSLQALIGTTMYETPVDQLIAVTAEELEAFKDKKTETPDEETGT